MNPLEKEASSPRPSPPQVCGGEGDGATIAGSWVQCALFFGEFAPPGKGMDRRRVQSSKFKVHSPVKPNPTKSNLRGAVQRSKFKVQRSKPGQTQSNRRSGSIYDSAFVFNYDSTSRRDMHDRGSPKVAKDWGKPPRSLATWIDRHQTGKVAVAEDVSGEGAGNCTRWRVRSPEVANGSRGRNRLPLGRGLGEFRR